MSGTKELKIGGLTFHSLPGNELGVCRENVFMTLEYPNTSHMLEKDDAIKLIKLFSDHFDLDIVNPPKTNASYLVDKRGNKSYIEYFGSVEKAQEALDSLNPGCTNCKNCKFCINCTDCVDCYYCVGCTGCNGCVNCTDCYKCVKGTNSNNCKDYKQKQK